MHKQSHCKAILTVVVCLAKSFSYPLRPEAAVQESYPRRIAHEAVPLDDKHLAPPHRQYMCAEPANELLPQQSHSISRHDIRNILQSPTRDIEY